MKKEKIIGLGIIGITLGVITLIGEYNEKTKQELTITQETIIEQSIEKEIEETETGTKVKTIEINYDKLQQLYLDINSEMTFEEVLTLVQESELHYATYYTNGERGKLIKIAYGDGVTKFRYADSGDHIEISFDDINDDYKNRNYVFSNMEYFNHNELVTIIEYKRGIYYDLRNEDEQGFYINDFSKNDYNKVDSKEEQLMYIFNK